MTGWNTRPRGGVLLICTITALASTAPGHASAADVTRCDGQVATIVGTDGRDDLVGTPGPDVIVGLAGADRISGAGATTSSAAATTRTG